jgi:hypothetical protein
MVVVVVVIEVMVMMVVEVMVMVVAVIVMVMMMVVILRHHRLRHRVGLRFVDGFQHRRGVGNGTKKLAERARLHDLFDVIGRRGGLRRGYRREGSDRSDNADYFLVHIDFSVFQRVVTTP